jgi:hypothetical protein
MTKLTERFALIGALTFLPSIARPQYAPSPGHQDAAAAVVVDSTPAQPAEPPPTTPPPPAQVRGPTTPAGQWIYTDQYGWIWMPYSDGYTYVPPDGYGEPYAYVYYPLYGWTWLAAPWVWGFGPWPYFGYYGPARFAWYGHGWWRNPSRWSYVPSRPGPRTLPTWRGSAGYGVSRPAPFRGGAVVRGGGYYTSPGGGRGAVPSGGAGSHGAGARGWGRGGRR